LPLLVEFISKTLDRKRNPLTYYGKVSIQSSQRKISKLNTKNNSHTKTEKNLPPFLHLGASCLEMTRATISKVNIHRYSMSRIKPLFTDERQCHAVRQFKGIPFYWFGNSYKYYNKMERPYYIESIHSVKFYLGNCTTKYNFVI